MRALLFLFLSCVCAAAQIPPVLRSATTTNLVVNNITATRKFLMQNGNGVADTPPVFTTLLAGDIPGLAYVTSVALTAPAEFTVTGSPVTSSGTLAITKANETANTVWAGPASGASTIPAFRSLVLADGGGVPTAATYNGGPMYVWGSTNNTLALVRPSMVAVTRSESMTGNGNGTMTVFGGNQAAAVTGTAASVAPLARVPYQVQAFSAASTASSAAMAFNNNTLAWNTPLHLMFIGNPTNITNVRFCFGATSGSMATVLGSTDPKTLHNMMIQVDTGVNTHYKIYASNGSTSSTGDNSVAAFTNSAVYEIIWDRVNNQIVGLVNGTVIGTVNSSLPAGAMKAFVGVNTLENVAKGVNLQWLEADQSFFPTP
jgi:hypothetical protein